MSELISQVADLSLTDKLSLIDSVVASIRKEGGMPAKKKVKGEKADGAPKPKRKAALGTLAWTAYVKHCKTTMPDSFEGLTKESEKLVIVKGIRAEDPEGYTAFTEAWKAEHAEVSDVSEAETESVAEEFVPAAKPVSAPKAAAKPAAKPAPKAAEPKAAAAAAAAKPAKAEKPVEKPVEKPAAKPAAAKPVAKKPVKAAKVEEPSMPQKEVDGVSYWHDPDSNGLWEVTGPTVVDGTGSWIGYFQPGDEAEPIRFTDAFGSD